MKNKTPWIGCILLMISGTCLAEGFRERLVAAALERTQHSVRYDGQYRRIAYPGGIALISKG